MKKVFEKLLVVILILSMTVAPVVPLYAGEELEAQSSFMYDRGFHIQNVDMHVRAGTSHTFNTNMRGTITWFTNQPNIIDIRGYTQRMATVSFPQAGSGQLTMHRSEDYLSTGWNPTDGFYLYPRTGVLRIVYNITVYDPLPQNNTTHFAGGSGTAASPYLISTPRHLANIGLTLDYLGAHYRLLNDIHFSDADFQSGGAFHNSGAGWAPIGLNALLEHQRAFTGNFNGDGYVVSGLHSAWYGSGLLAGSRIGLFAHNSGTIRNVGVVNSEFHGFTQNGNAGLNFIGAIAGMNQGTIEFCWTDNNFLGGDAVGGIAGGNTGTIRHSYARNSTFFTTPDRRVLGAYGGITAMQQGGTLNEVYATSIVRSYVFDGTSLAPSLNDVGGVAAIVQRSGTVSPVISNVYWSSFNVPADFLQVVAPLTRPVVHFVPFSEMNDFSRFSGLPTSRWHMNNADQFILSRGPRLNIEKALQNSLVVISQPTKEIYVVGESFEPSGMILGMKKSDGSFETIDVAAQSVVFTAPSGGTDRDTVYITGFNSTTGGTKILTVHFNNMTTQFEVYVLEEFTAVPPTVSAVANQTVTAGQSAVFVADVTGNPAPSLQWEVQIITGGSWTAIAGATTNTLTLTNTTTAMNGNRYRLTANNGGADVISNAATLTVNAPVVNRTITFAANGGTGTMPAQTVQNGASFTIPANTFTRAGHTFSGWAASGAATGDFAAGATIANVQGDITLTAQWTRNQDGIPLVGEIIRFGERNWRVLDVEGNYAKILHESVMTFQQYNNAFANVTWETSSVRAWLNGEFFNSFSVSDRARIRETTVLNPNNPQFGTAGGNTTTDRIFLLSIAEAQQYFNSDAARIARSTGGVASWWWLRSPGSASNSAAVVLSNGLLSTVGTSVSSIEGLRPALWLNIPALANRTISFVANGGTGTMPAQTVTSGDNFTIPANIFTREGYTFDGWAASGAATGNFAAGATIANVTGDITLTAQWTQNQDGIPQIGEIIRFGGRNWLVLDVQGNHAKILHETVMSGRPYHHTLTNVTWETSSSRVWLNGEFFNSFSVSDRARIRETTVLNPPNPWFDTLGGNTTTDRIFLLSIAETQQYFSNDAARIARGEGGGTSWWWLRTPGSASNRAAEIGSDGAIFSSGTFVNSALSIEGLRPALWLNFQTDTPRTITFAANGGTGTMPAQTVATGGNFSVPPTQYVLDGHVFGGWTASGATTGNFAAGATIANVQGNITLTAQWLKIGDLDGDGNITAADVTFLARSVANHSGFALSDNRIGNLAGFDRPPNPDDITLMARWLVGYDLQGLIKQTLP
jgi:uncharacterized repeat protein (TIGR02543 family)